MNNENNTDDTVYTQTSYSGKLRWVIKPLCDEPILQHEEVTTHYNIACVITRVETKWVDVPVEYYDER